MIQKNDISAKHKNNKTLYYIESYLKAFIPHVFLRANIDKQLARFSQEDKDDILERVNYYNKLNTEKTLNSGISYKGLDIFGKGKVYPLDLLYYLKHFPKTATFTPLFGDITHIPNEPSITKSRPIAGDNENSVLFHLNRIRHFTFVKNDKAYLNKKNALVWRGFLDPKHKNRHAFLKAHIDSSNMDIGYNKGYPEVLAWKKPALTIAEQLEYKFIMSLEGHDVATNLKWIMSSNSLCFSPKMRFETWFMEGRLQPNVHYVEVNDDFSDVEEKIQFYIDNPDKAQAIIHNAQNYVARFMNKDKERVIKLMVLDKYFKMTK